MFTGIITNTGTVTSLTLQGEISTMAISIPSIKAKIGQSIAVNGVCLTVTKTKSSTFTFEVVGETLKRSTLGTLKKGSQLNIEKSLKLGDELDGSFVLGHVDCTATLKKISRSGKNTDLTFELPSSIKKFVSEKGGIVIDGISLTVTTVTKSSFSVTVIPHTLKATTLKSLFVGQKVNIEVDVIARYVYNCLI